MEQAIKKNVEEKTSTRNKWTKTIRILFFVFSNVFVSEHSALFMTSISNQFWKQGERKPFKSITNSRLKIYLKRFIQMIGFFSLSLSLAPFSSSSFSFLLFPFSLFTNVCIFLILSAFGNKPFLYVSHVWWRWMQTKKKFLPYWIDSEKSTRHKRDAKRYIFMKSFFLCIRATLPVTSCDIKNYLIFCLLIN